MCQPASPSKLFLPTHLPLLKCWDHKGNLETYLVADHEKCVKLLLLERCTYQYGDGKFLGDFLTQKISLIFEISLTKRSLWKPQSITILAHNFVLENTSWYAVSTDMVWWRCIQFTELYFLLLFSWITSFSWNVVVILWILKIFVVYSVSLQRYTLCHPIFNFDSLTFFP